jgi:thiol-disulfide isomerase/thioredoxin
VRRTPGTALLVCGVILIGAAAGCTSHAVDPRNGDYPGYVSADGTVNLTAADERVPVPDIRGTTLHGSSYDLAHDLGHVVVLNFWAEWCAPCRNEQPMLNSVYNDTSKHGVRFLGVNINDDDAAARAFERHYQVAYPSIVDHDDEIALTFDPHLPDTPPTTVVIDRQGRVAARLFGTTERGVLAPIIEQLLKEPARSSTS